MKKLLHLFLTASLLGLSASASAPEGYLYQTSPAEPDGGEWQDCRRIALNKEAPRATFYSFESVDAARAVAPEASRYRQSLDGEWSFRWVGNPWERDSTFQRPERDLSDWDKIVVPSCWNIAGLQKDGSQRYGTPIYVNQKVIFMHKVAVDDWRGGVMRTPPETWTTYKNRNEVGQYRRPFSVPADWKGREVYICFDGVDSFFYLWINGRYVGFSKNSRNAARFDITPYLNEKGGNTVAVEVYRNSDGSFLEAQDMFRLPGIFRSVALYSTPKVQIRDLTVVPDLTDNYTDGRLDIRASVRNLGKKDIKDYRIEYRLFANDLYSDANSPVPGLSPEVSAPLSAAADGGESLSETSWNVPSPRLWSAEAPWRYTLVASLLDRKGRTVETVSTHIGFRKVEIRDTPAEEDSFGKAGRYFYVNGKQIKLRGVNRHETCPEAGHTLTPAQMEEDIMLMKRANINHVRNCHYPEAPYWYELCDKYGIYLEDEANIESHEYYYGDASLSHPAEWRDAHVARELEMVRSNVNHPSIVIWSLGNEAGPGDNFKAAYAAIKDFDKSRPVQYERNNHIVDMGSNQYPDVSLTRAIASGKLKDTVYPFHISEYAHSMGNAVGTLAEIWDEVESSNFICGGAIWDWVDQSLYNHDPKTGTRYLAYGGDFGDFPNDGQFVMNGIVFADREPKPAYYEVKKVYQPLVFKTVDMSRGTFEVFNRNYFEPLDDYGLFWQLAEDGAVIASGELSEKLPTPRQSVRYTVPYDLTGHDGEIFLTVEARLLEPKPWADAGYAQMAGQMLVREAATKSTPAISGNAVRMVLGGKTVKKVASLTSPLTVGGDGFRAVFDPATGSLSELEYDGRPAIVAGQGPKLDAFRAFVNNDNWIYEKWYANGLHNLRSRAENGSAEIDADGNAVIRFRVISQAPNGAVIKGGTSSRHNTVEEQTDKPFGSDDFRFTTEQTWTIRPDGSVELSADIVGSDSTLVLPRLGYTMQVPAEYSAYTYYGRGPVENYSDRKTGQFVGLYSGTVAGQFVNYPKPQNMANREDVRRLWLTGSDGRGIAAEGALPMSVTALPYDEQDLVFAPHPHELPAPGATRLHLDIGQTGLGGTSCGQAPPLPSARVTVGRHSFSFTLSPIRPSDSAKFFRHIP